MKDPVVLDEQKFDRIQTGLEYLRELREQEADEINWTQRGEDRINDFTPEAKAEQLRDLLDHQLAAMFNLVLFATTDWNPNEPTTQDVSAAKAALHSIRAEQANLAREEFMEYGHD